MLFVLFQLGRDRYALAANQVVEVAPLVHLKKIPQAPAGVAGVFDYRGTPVPVVDLNALLFGVPAPLRLSTRIVLVRYPVEGGQTFVLGLIAPRVTETMALEPSDFSPAGVDVENAPYLGPVARTSQGLIQRVEVNQLLPATVRDRLFRERGEGWK